MLLQFKNDAILINSDSLGDGFDASKDLELFPPYSNNATEYAFVVIDGKLISYPFYKNVNIAKKKSCDSFYLTSSSVNCN